MFGYVRPQRAGLSEEDKERYGAVYCGLCHTMGERYGLLARFSLNYDFAFLAMVLARPGDCPPICRRRCPAHPFRRVKGCLFFEGLEAAADESLILTWYKLRDDAADKSFFASLPSRLLSRLLGRAYRRAAALRPEFDRSVRRYLEELRGLEKEGSASLDRTAHTFASILECAAPKSGDVNRDRVAAQLLYHVGRWIYLTDAWDDLAEDRAQGSYNPLLARFDGHPEEHIDDLRITMTHSLRLAMSAGALGDFGEFGPIIENILYLGLPAVQEAVLTGRWREMRKSKEKDHE